MMAVSKNEHAKRLKEVQSSFIIMPWKSCSIIFFTFYWLKQSKMSTRFKGKEQGIEEGMG